MTFEKDFGYRFKGEIANLPTTPPFIRRDFEKWWKELCKLADEQWQPKPIEEITLRQVLDMLVKKKIISEGESQRMYGDYLLSVTK